MGFPGVSQVSKDKAGVEEETTGLTAEVPRKKEEAIEVQQRVRALRWSPLSWFRMLADEMHWSFVFGVVTVYGISQGLGGAIWRVASDYYWKDVQKVQPSSAQVYNGITSLPWIVKPLWGLLTDVLPMAGYRRRPYLILAGKQLNHRKIFAFFYTIKRLVHVNLTRCNSMAFIFLPLP